MIVGDENSDRVVTKQRQHRYQPTPIMQMMAKTSAFNAQTARNTRAGTIDRVIPAPAKHPSLNSTGVAGAFESVANNPPPISEASPRPPDLVFGEHIKDKNPYLTTTQMFYLGKKTEPKKKEKVKVWMEITPEMTINQITGQPIDSMVKLLEGLENAKKKDAAEQAALMAARGLESEDGEIENILIMRLKEYFKSRGVTGIMGLSRKFRIMDDDDSKSLSYPEFSKAINETGLNFNEEEKQCLFSMFDVYSDGFISYEEFVDALSDNLNKRRKLLVNMAFDILDRDCSGLVDIRDFAMIYDTSKHPDVISGKKTRDQVLRDLITVFEFGNRDGIVTRAEFELYYRHIGASIDNDDYFELMIRNAWQMVDATTAAGGASGPPKGFNKDAMLKRLQDEKLVPGTSASMPAVTMPAPPPTFDRPLTVRSRYALTQKAVISKQSAVQDYEVYVSALVSKLRSQLIGDDGSGLITLQRKFRDADEDDSQALDPREFKRAIKIFTSGLTDKDIEALFNLFDRDNSGTIAYPEFVDVIRGRLNARRQAIVDLAFSHLDTEGNGLLDPIAVIKTYNPDRHPDVLAHVKTAEQQRKDFLDAFDVGGQVEGAVTKDEFQNYYANLGAAISSDDFFEVMVRNVWRISDSQGSSAAGTSSARGGAGNASARSGGSRTVAPSLMNQLMGIAPPKNAPIEISVPKSAGGGRTVGAPTGGSIQEAHGSSGPVANAEPLLTEETIARAGPNAAPSSSAKLAAGSLPARPRTAGAVSAQGCLTAGFTPRPTSRVSTARPSGPQPSAAIEPNPGVKMILTKLKADIKSRGLYGFSQLQRIFRSMDVDDSKSLSLPEFSAAMKELKVQASDKELRWLFEFFDKDQSGSVNFEEFIVSVREPLSAARQALIDVAFAKLDRSSTGFIDAHTLATSYDTSRHPEVIAERMTQNGAMKEFFESFDMGGEVEGKVTANEFNNYYANIGAVISNDDYFEMLLRNTWQLGAKSAPALNSARSAGGSGNLVLGGSGMVSKLRGEVSFAEDLTAVMGLVKELQSQAVQHFQKKNYAKSIQIFEQILSIFTEHGIPADHPEYTRSEKSIAACKKKAKMS